MGRYIYLDLVSGESDGNLYGLTTLFDNSKPCNAYLYSCYKVHENLVILTRTMPYAMLII